MINCWSLFVDCVNNIVGNVDNENVVGLCNDIGWLIAIVGDWDVIKCTGRNVSASDIDDDCDVIKCTGRKVSANEIDDCELIKCTGRSVSGNDKDDDCDVIKCTGRNVSVKEREVRETELSTKFV